MIRSRPAAILLIVVALAGCGPSDPLESIRQQQAVGDYSGSIEALRALLVEQPQNAEAAYLYGRALILTGQHSLATWSLLRAMEDPAWFVPAGMQLAHAALVMRDFNEAVNITTRILETHPEDTQALLFRAQAHAHWKAHPDLGLADAERALELEPDLLEAYEPRILSLLALERPEEANAVLAEVGVRLEEADAARGVRAWHCMTTGLFATDAGEIDRARETFTRCLEEYPDFPNVVTQVVEFHDRQHELDRSIAILQAALADAPEQRGFRTALAERLRATGQRAEAEALLRKATEVDDARQAAAAWSDLALFHQSLAEHEAAATALEQAIARIREVEKPSAMLLFRYADSLLMSGQLDRALEAAEDVPVAAQRRLIRGRVAQEQGDPARALEEFDEALRVWPDNAPARYYAALEAEKLGDFDRALEEYRYSIRIDPGATDARTRAARMLIAERRFDPAYQLLFLKVDESPLEAEGELLGMYLMARVANPQQLQTALAGLAARNPARVPEALARAADGAAELAGPTAALNLLITAPGIQVHPLSAPLLRAIVRYAHAADQASIAGNMVEPAVEAQPDVAVFHEVLGLHRELSGAPPEQVEAIYAKAIELDPANAGALQGLGRSTRERDPTAAIAFFDRAAAADVDDPAPRFAAARILLETGKPDEARPRLDALLLDHPYHAAAATELVALDLEAGSVTSKTLDRGRRAAKFGGGIRAYEQLEQVYAALDLPEEAAEAARRAGILRERAAARPKG